MADSDNTDDIFLRTEPKYFPLLNTYVRDFHYMGKVYKTAEHLFQALKFLDEDVAETIRQCNNPLTEATTNPNNLDKKRVDWYFINKTALKIAFFYKFLEHQDLRKLLLDTGSRALINNVEDRFWGLGKEFNGGNQFGRVLEELREEFAFGDPVPPILLHPGESRFRDRDSIFHNSAQVPVRFDDNEWMTSEHLFQAWKFSDTDHQKAIFEATRPEEALDLGKQKKENVREDWDVIEIDVMTYIVYLKFANGLESTRKALIDTRGAEMMYISDDELWGCAKGNGRNELGNVLMRVRDIILCGFSAPSEPPNPPLHKGKAVQRWTQGDNTAGPSGSK